MVYEYVVTLRNSNRKLIDRFSLLLIGTSVILFLAEYLQSAEKRWVQILGVGLILGLVALNFYLKRKHGKDVYYNYALYFTALVWATMPQYQWLSIFFVIMGLIERQAKKNLEIGFSSHSIVFNSFPRKIYKWKDFSNIILRDNLLTLDFLNNKIFQRETIDEESDCDENEFNDYCREKLELSRTNLTAHPLVGN